MTRSFFLPEGVASARKASYAMVNKIEAPDDLTVVFQAQAYRRLVPCQSRLAVEFYLQRRKAQERSALV